MTRPIVAPIQVIDTIEPDAAWNAAWGPNPLSFVKDQDTTRCAHCGQRITWRVVVKDGKGVYHAVGQTCAAEIEPRSAGVIKLSVTRAGQRAQAEKERAAAAAELVEFIQPSQTTMALSAKPHPMTGKATWARKLSMLDYANWWLNNAKAKREDLVRALNACQRALGVKTKWEIEQEAKQAAEEAKRAAEVEEKLEGHRVALRPLVGKEDELVEKMTARLAVDPDYPVVDMVDVIEEHAYQLRSILPGGTPRTHPDYVLAGVGLSLSKRLKALVGK